MIEKYAGKGSSKYKIFITNKTIPSGELNKNINKNCKVLIVLIQVYLRSILKILKIKLKIQKFIYILSLKAKLQNHLKPIKKSLKNLSSLNFLEQI